MNRITKIIAYSVALCAIFLILIFEIVALFLWVPGTWDSKISVILAIIGIYGLSVGFLPRIQFLKDNPEILLNDLVSPDILKYIGGISYFFVYTFRLYWKALKKQRAGFPLPLWFVSTLLLLISIPMGFIFFILYMLIVLPIAYIPLLAISAVVSRIEYAAKDTGVTVTDKQGKKKTFLLSRVITDDPITAKGFLIGIPAIIFAVYGTIAKLFIT